MLKPFVRTATEEDAVSLSMTMRKIDRLEIKYSHNYTPIQALVSCFNLPKAENFTITDEQGFVYGMFGVSECQHDNKFGVIWLLCSEKLKEIPISFYRECKQWIDYLSQNYSYVYNLVYEKNWQSLKWLQLCGFVAERKLKIGSKKKNFILIIKETCVTQQQSQLPNSL
jgi:hypothetical protein